jgi:hypothetical protein
MSRQQSLRAIQVTLRLDEAILSSLNPNCGKAQLYKVMWMATTKNGLTDNSEL